MILLYGLKEKKQSRIESEIVKTNNYIASIHDEINILKKNKDENLTDKKNYVKSFYNKLKECGKFNSNNLFELEVETAKYAAKRQEIEQNIDFKFENLRQAEQQCNELHQQLKQVVTQLEKYNFILNPDNHA